MDEEFRDKAELALAPIGWSPSSVFMPSSDVNNGERSKEQTNHGLSLADEQDFRERAMLAIAPLRVVSLSDYSGELSTDVGRVDEVSEKNLSKKVETSPNNEDPSKENVTNLADTSKKGGNQDNEPVQNLCVSKPQWSDSSWMIHYKDLVEYKSEFGHCKVPRGYKSNPQLAKLVAKQHACLRNHQASRNKPTTTMTTFEPQTFPLESRTTFPYKLFSMLESCSSNDKPAITWLPHGRAFTIIDKDKFMAEIAPLYFSQTQFRSFLRQLGLWGFTR